MGPPGDSVTQSAIWEALAIGPTPTLTRHANAGIGSSHTITGTRWRVKVALTTGTGVVSGGTLFTIVLTGYDAEPFAAINPRDEVSAATFPFCHTTQSLLTVRVAGEIEPGTVYSYDIVMMGT